jgi:predicted GNAT family acetyltransferase
LKRALFIVICAVIVCTQGSCRQGHGLAQPDAPVNTVEGVDGPEASEHPAKATWIQDVELFAKENEESLRKLLQATDRLPLNTKVTYWYVGEAVYTDRLGWIYNNKTVSLDDALRLQGIDKDLYEILLKEIKRLDILGVCREQEGNRILLMAVTASISNSLVIDLSDTVLENYRAELPDQSLEPLEVPVGWWRVTLPNGFYALLSRD